MIKLLDLFCGCGGLSTGLNPNIFKILAALDNWEPAIKTYSLNHKSVKVLNQDINLFNKQITEGDHKELIDIDVIVGGPPCQGFSGMNRYRNVDDPRNSLIESFVQTVELLNPKVVLLENVTGIMSLGDGIYFQALLDKLEYLGFNYDFGIFQAGYYGLPQNRWRFICVASKTNEEIIFPEPAFEFSTTAAHNVGKFKNKIIRPLLDGHTLFSNLKKTINVFDAISDLPSINNGEKYEGVYTESAKSNYQKWIRQKSSNILNHKCQKVGDLHLERFSHIPVGKPNSGWLDLPDHLKPENLKTFSSSSYDNRFGRLTWDGRFNAIMGKVEPYWGRVIHPIDNRLISLRECARAQGFPDKFTFDEKFTDSIKMIGNAIPIPLSMAISSTLSKCFGIEDNYFLDFVDKM